MDEQDDTTVPCPNCGQGIFDDSEQCPHCRQYISAADLKKQLPTWVVVLIVLTIVSFLLPTLLTTLRIMSDQ